MSSGVVGCAHVQTLRLLDLHEINERMSLDRSWNTAQRHLTLSLFRDSIDMEGG